MGANIGDDDGLFLSKRSIQPYYVAMDSPLVGRYLCWAMPNLLDKGLPIFESNVSILEPCIVGLNWCSIYIGGGNYFECGMDSNCGTTSIWITTIAYVHYWLYLLF